MAALLAGVAGAALFTWLALPLPWLLGAILANLLLTRLPRVPLAQPRPLLNPMRAVLGIAVGAAFTPALVQQLGAYALSLALMLPYVALAGALGMLYFHRLLGYDRATAFFSAIPGGLVEMIVLGQALGANTGRVALTQTTRVLLIVYTLPFLLAAMSGVDLGGGAAINPPLAEVGPIDLATMAAVAALGWWAAARLGISGASIVGPMLAGAAVYLLGWVSARPPSELLNAAQLVLGTSIGCAFAGTSFADMLRTIRDTLGYFLILMVTALLFALLSRAVTGLTLESTLLAFSPGGQAETNLIAIMIGANVPFVALHHLLRLALVMAVAPWVFRALRGRI